MKCLKIIFVFIVLSQLCRAKTPPFKPIADNVKQTLEYTVSKCLVEGAEAGKYIKAVQKFTRALGAVAPVLGLVDSALILFAPSDNAKLEGKVDQLGANINQLKQKIEQNHQEIMNTLNKNHKELLSRLNSIEHILNLSFDRVERRVEFNKFSHLLTRMKSEYEHFGQMIRSYSSNETELAAHLDEFIRHYRNEKYESNFVNQLTQTFGGMEPPLHFIYERALIDHKNVFNPVKTSPNRVMVDFYYSTLHLIYKGYYMLSYCYCLRDSLRNIDPSSTDQNFVLGKMNQDIDNLNKAYADLQTLATNDGLDININIPRGTHQIDFQWHFLYTGDVKVEKNGYVVTGAKFISKPNGKQNTLYLQIQVGELLPSGFINENSVYWQAEPRDLLTNRVMALNLQKVQLRDLNFEKALVTGLKLIWRGIDKMDIKLYGRHYENKLLGSEVELEETAQDSEFEMKFGSINSDDSHGYELTKKRTLICGKIIYATVYPLFDGSNVTLDIPVPISGLGLMHYANNDDARGSVRPYLKTYHYKYLL